MLDNFSLNNYSTLAIALNQNFLKTKRLNYKIYSTEAYEKLPYSVVSNHDPKYFTSEIGLQLCLDKSFIQMTNKTNIDDIKVS